MLANNGITNIYIYIYYCRHGLFSIWYLIYNCNNCYFHTIMTITYLLDTSRYYYHEHHHHCQNKTYFLWRIHRWFIPIDPAVASEWVWLGYDDWWVKSLRSMAGSVGIHKIHDKLGATAFSNKGDMIHKPT